METSEAIRTRRNVRAFADEPIDADVLKQIVDAARHAPSSMNEQRWAFILVTERERLRELAKMGRYASHVADAAAAVALVVPDAEDPEERESIAFDLGQAAQSLMLAAWEEGVASCHGSVYQPDRARELLGYPDGSRCDLLISLGYPAYPSVRTSPPKRGGRKPLDEVLHRERW